MPNSPRMLWPYPGENQDPWYDVFESLLLAQDSSGYAAREDRQLLCSGGGMFSFEASSGELSWSSDFQISNPITARKTTVLAGSVVVPDSNFVYVILARGLLSNNTASFHVSMSVPNTDDAYVIGVRSGSNFYFRTGAVLPGGSSFDIFFGGSSGAGSDIYERSSTFIVPEGTGDQEATLGRVLYAGALTGLVVETTRPVTAGTITVNAKIDGVTALSVVLSTSANTTAMTTASPTAHPVSSGAPVTVEVVTSGYANGDGLDGGLSVSIGFTTNVDLVPTEIPFSGTGQAGITYLSCAPVSPTYPIALSASDPSVAYLNKTQTYTKAQGVQSADITYAPFMVIDATQSNSFSVIFEGDGVLGNPTGLVGGFSYVFRLSQDAVGGHLISFDTAWKFPGGVPLTLTATASAVDIISAVSDGTNLYCTFIQDVR